MIDRMNLRGKCGIGALLISSSSHTLLFEKETADMHFSGIAALVVFFSFGLANPPWSLETILAVMACGVGLDWLVHRLIRPPREDAQKAKETFDNCQSWDQEGQHW